MTPSELKQTRQALNLTQAQLAAQLQVGRNTVARWEMGEVPISRVTELAIRYLVALAHSSSSLGRRSVSAD